MKINRLYSLDVFRGLAIALMILVNSPGNKTAYPWLVHASWNGCTFADVVFPFFIMIVGMSTVFSLTNQLSKGASETQLLMHIFKRSIYLFMMGLLLNAFPNHFDFSTIRIPGVLQRIAICYGISSILFLKTRAQTQGIIFILLLIFYWLLLTVFATNFPLTPENNLVGYIDKILLSPQHLYTPNFDPEGILSTIPAIASTLLGNLLGIFFLRNKNKKQLLFWTIIAGIILSITGWLWGFIFPINKSLWTSSYVLWTGGLGLLVFALCFAWADIKQWRFLTKSLTLFGNNAMLVYMLHIIFLKIQARILITNNEGISMNLRLYLTDTLFGNFTAENASLCYAIAYTLLWLLVLQGIVVWRKWRR